MHIEDRNQESNTPETTNGSTANESNTTPALTMAGVYHTNPQYDAALGHHTRLWLTRDD